MTGVTRIAKLDFFIMKSQGISYLSLVAVILMFGLMGSSITVLCITGAWFIALMATNIFAIQEKNHLDRLYGSVCVSLNEVVLGRYTFVFLNYLATMFTIILLRMWWSLRPESISERALTPRGWTPCSWRCPYRGKAHWHSMPDASTEIMKESRKFVSAIMWISMFLPWSGCIINA